MKLKKKTISVNFYDDEVLFKDPETGDIHLKPGVHRSNYNDWINPEELESHINEQEIMYKKIESVHKKDEAEEE